MCFYLVGPITFIGARTRSRVANEIGIVLGCLKFGDFEALRNSISLEIISKYLGVYLAVWLLVSSVFRMSRSHILEEFFFKYIRYIRQFDSNVS